MKECMYEGWVFHYEFALVERRPSPLGENILVSGLDERESVEGMRRQKLG